MDLLTLLPLIAKISILVFVVGSMFALGLNLTVTEILDPLKNKKLVALALLVNFVLVPLLAYAVLFILPVGEGVRIGLILLATAAGAPFLPKLAEVAKGDIAFSVGLMLLLMVGTVIYLPLVLPLALEGAEVDALQIAKSLVITMLLPLFVGLFLRAKSEALSLRCQPYVAKLSNLALVLLAVLLVSLNFSNILSMIGWGGFAIVLFIAVSLGAGLLLGGSQNKVRNVMGLGAAQRNVSAALVVGQSLNDPQVLVVLVVAAIMGLLMLMPIAKILGKGQKA
ncbi:MAG: bile acid:sodium symporter [Verrucomicrobiales bacterium]|nr:bile acid:sodium symporter [Verrucomicrobiales bacterium]